MKTFRELVSLAAVFILASFGLLFAANVRAGSSEPFEGTDAVIVLGCGLNGRSVSLMLRHRLDKALEYYTANKGTVIVTSGGQGDDEPVAEALAMRDYLVGKGVPSDDIIMEDKSTSTNENFLFSKEKLDERFGRDGYTALFVTSDFHVLRSGIYAERVGLSIQGLAAPSVPHLLPMMYIREYLALMWYYVIDAWGI
ncbi:MAG: YdcF family protein [Clostridiales bacterium]|jgi:uncharacterized SAM-binding protein YcdF (DUF218 family)|nr:YdcF family protein [Clostridiales bacterium]